MMKKILYYLYLYHIVFENVVKMQNINNKNIKEIMFIQKYS